LLKTAPNCAGRGIQELGEVRRLTAARLHNLLHRIQSRWVILGTRASGNGANGASNRTSGIYGILPCGEHAASNLGAKQSRAKLSNVRGINLG
jgi:hypothetical protein